jgi:hypothetical protein
VSIQILSPRPEKNFTSSDAKFFSLTRMRSLHFTPDFAVIQMLNLNEGFDEISEMEGDLRLHCFGILMLSHPWRWRLGRCPG